MRRFNKTAHWKIAVVAIIVAMTLLMAGCLNDPPSDVVRLQAGVGDLVVITVDGEGWLVARSGEKGTYVTEQIVIETTQPTVPILWRNEDDRYHEVMFHQDHTDDDAVRMNPGDKEERSVPQGFERHVHSHYAPELPELTIRVTGEGNR